MTEKVIAIPDDKADAQVPKDHVELIQKFVDAFKGTQSQLDNSDMDGAAQGYKDMLAVYNQMSSSDLDPLHKELAYDQLVKVYQGLKSPAPSSSVHTTTHIVAAAVLLVLFSFLVFFKPAVFGAAVVDTKVVQDVNWAFVESGARDAHLDSVPKSLRITGKVDGDGFVRAYAVTENGRTLVFDNDLSRVNPDGTFTAACVNTCTGFSAQDFTLDVVVENAALTVYSFEYRS